MPSFENVCENVFKEKDFLKKFLIGGLLSMIPFLSVVYFVEVSKEFHQKKRVILPDWENYLQMLKSGYQGIILLLVYFGIPWFVGAILSEIIEWITFGGVGLIEYLPLLILLSVAPAFYATSIYFLVRGAVWKDLLDVKNIAQMLFSIRQYLIFPTLIFWGLMFLGAPVYGFSFFLGFLIYLIYIQILFSNLERNQK